MRVNVRLYRCTGTLTVLISWLALVTVLAPQGYGIHIRNGCAYQKLYPWLNRISKIVVR